MLKIALGKILKNIPHNQEGKMIHSAIVNVLFFNSDFIYYLYNLKNS